MTQDKKDLLRGQLISLRRGVGLQVCYHSGNSPALVFLHGGLGNRFNWRSQYEFFATQGREVLAYDLGGHGQSTPYPRYSLGRHRRDLVRLLQRFQVDSPVLCCHSYGVPLGLEYARLHQVQGLVLIAGGTHDLDPWWEIPLMKLLKWGGRYLYHLPGVQALTSYLSSPHSGERIERFFSESPIPTEAHPYKALEIFWGYNFFKRSSSSINYQVPILVISGGQDPTFTESMGETLATSFPNSQHWHLPAASHVLMAEFPDVINQKISAWLSEINP